MIIESGYDSYAREYGTFFVDELKDFDEKLENLKRKIKL